MAFFRQFLKVFGNFSTGSATQKRRLLRHPSSTYSFGSPHRISFRADVLSVGTVRNFPCACRDPYLSVGMVSYVNKVKFFIRASWLRNCRKNRGGLGRVYLYVCDETSSISSPLLLPNLESFSVVVLKGNGSIVKRRWWRGK